MRIFRHMPTRMALFLGILILVGAIFAVYITQYPKNAIKNTTLESIVIDYTTPIRKLDPIAIGMDISGYEYPYVFANDPNEQQKLKSLSIKYMRVDLKYSTSGDPTSKIICAANGCDTRWSGDNWVHAIKAIGAQPLIIVSYNPVDAANMVRHFNKDTDLYVKYWIVGNEPDHAGISASEYSNDFNQDYDAMKAIDPTIKIGGGTTAWYDTPFLQTFLQLSGSRVDFVDFHSYGQQGDVPGDYATLFHMAANYSKSINNLRSLIEQIVPARASQIGIQVGEWELNWGGSAQANTNFHAVWTSSVLGHILSSGGWSLFYADKGNALYGYHQSITASDGRIINVDVDDTNPAYHGIGMFTGEQLFRGFGDTIVEANTTDSHLEVYASDNPKNIVVINKDPSIARTATITLHGATGQGQDKGASPLPTPPTRTLDVWRKDEAVLFLDPPTQLSTLSLSNGTFTYQFPPFSTTTFILKT
jgi:hypothetical protein